MNVEFWKTFGNTLYFTLGTVIVQLIVGMTVALLMNTVSDGIGIGLIRPIIILPLATASVAVSYGWKLLLNPTVGLIPYVISLLGIPEINFLTNPFLVIPSLIIIDTWQWAPFMIIILMGAMLALPIQPYEAAKIDGADYFQVFRHITIPLMLPTIIFATMLRFIDSFKVFDLIYLVTTGGPGRSSESINMYAFNQAFNRLRMGDAAAISIIMLIILILVSNIFKKFSSFSD